MGVLELYFKCNLMFREYIGLCKIYKNKLNTYNNVIKDSKKIYDL